MVTASWWCRKTWRPKFWSRLRLWTRPSIRCTAISRSFAPWRKLFSVSAACNSREDSGDLHFAVGHGKSERDDDRRRSREHQRQAQHGLRIVSRPLLDQAYGGRPQKSAEIAEHVDQRDATRRRG